MSRLPFSQACENNKQPIYNVLQSAFAQCSHILEIGSGTGQHAVFFASMMPWLQWQPSDRSENIESIQQWRDHAQLENLAAPIELDVTQQIWKTPDTIDGIFSANTCHIMSWSTVQMFFKGVSKTLKSNGKFCVYGPFNYNGDYTSPSNAQFDVWLKNRDPLSGIRDQEQIVSLALSVNLELEADHAMPANNRLLVFRKLTDFA